MFEWDDSSAIFICLVKHFAIFKQNIANNMILLFVFVLFAIKIFECFGATMVQLPLFHQLTVRLVVIEWAWMNNGLHLHSWLLMEKCQHLAGKEFKRKSTRWKLIRHFWQVGSNWSVCWGGAPQNHAAKHERKLCKIKHWVARVWVAVLHHIAVRHCAPIASLQAKIMHPWQVRTN